MNKHIKHIVHDDKNVSGKNANNKNYAQNLFLKWINADAIENKSHNPNLNNSYGLISYGKWLRIENNKCEDVNTFTKDKKKCTGKIKTYPMRFINVFMFRFMCKFMCKFRFRLRFVKTLF